MLIEILKHSLMITSFVLIMMLVIEYVNVQTRGQWQETLRKSRWGQYLLGAMLGALPGCLGAFTVVTLYNHSVLSLGALVATMIATSGDEAFVMFSMFPQKALMLTMALMSTGIIAGVLTDRIFQKNRHKQGHADHELPIHQEDSCHCFSMRLIGKQLVNITFPRAILITLFTLLILFLMEGSVGPHDWHWEKITILLGSAFSLFVIITVPDHFLEKHLWEHVIKKHLLRIFLWTFAAILVIHVLEDYIQIESWIKDNYFMVLLIAVLIGIIPESGPHLVFVTLFANGTLPFSILLASSIVQDGHGMLPLLAVSKKDFFLVKALNIVVGLVVGSLGLFLF